MCCAADVPRVRYSAAYPTGRELVENMTKQFLRWQSSLLSRLLYRPFDTDESVIL